MSLPTAQQDGVFSHVYPVTDLGFTPVSGSNDNITLASSGSQSAASIFSTGVPATVLFLTQASTGSGTLNVCVGAAGFTPNYGSPTASLAISGTSEQVLAVNTAFVYDDSSIETTTITTDQRWIGVELASSGGMTLTGFAILVLYELTPGEDWFTGIRASANAVANQTVGDGGGLVTLNPVYAHNPYLNANVLL